MFEIRIGKKTIINPDAKNLPSLLKQSGCVVVEQTFKENV
jgi:hypothetical protein